MIAALYVDPNGSYADLPDVDVWGEERDARLYDGPWPVVAHPPCARWSIMGACRGYRDGEDGGCFAAALEAVRRFGWSTEVDQHAYGLRFRKPTWLYYVGPEPPPLVWRRAGRAQERASNGRDLLSIHNHHGWGNGQRSSTPPAFREALLGMARTACVEAAA